MKKLFKTFLILSFWYPALQAQDAIPASGGNASGSGGSVSYSVGQLVYSSQTGNSGTVSEGVQQAFVIEVISAVFNSQDINLSAYPNPTSNFLTLQTSNLELIDLKYQVFDINGRLLINNTIEEKDTRIELENFPSATYILKVMSKSTSIKEFKIIKK